MDDWRCRFPAAPHLTSAIPHFHGLDFGRTMPLRHPPNGAHPRITLGTAPQSFLSFSPPVGPAPRTVTSHELSISPSSTSFSSPQLQPSANEGVRAQSAEKKRWQTANYRWMFTKRKGKKQIKGFIKIKRHKNCCTVSEIPLQMAPIQFAIMIFCIVIYQFVCFVLLFASWINGHKI